MVTAVEFDFNTKRERTIPASDARAACETGLFCWVDVDAGQDRAGAEQVLRDLGVNDYAIKEAVGPDQDGRHDTYDDCLHTAVTAASFDRETGKFVPSHVDIVIGERFLVTLRRGPVEFVEQVRKHYRQDFLRFAKTPSFLLYEYWDHLISNYRKALQVFEDQVERLQSQIFGAVDDAIFGEVAAVTQDLLRFRKIMLAAREVLHELATRRSAFVAESSQPFLERMVGTMERLVADLATERETLAETLNLYMGITSHRTSRIVSRLTVVSMIFLPLTFLCGIYGMNFEVLPELKWPLGYAMFWAVALVTAVGLLGYMKWRKWW